MKPYTLAKLFALTIMLVLLLAPLTGCSTLGQSTPAALPTVVLDSGGPAPQATSLPLSGGVTASGIVAPAQQAQLAFSSGGNLDMLEVAVGDPVQAGQVVARLAGAEQLQAAVSSAELEVLSAQQALQKLTDDLPDQQVAALQAVKDARDALHRAEQRLRGLGVPSEPLDIEVARSNVALARRDLEQAQKDFEPYANKPENNLKRAALLSQLSDAQQRYDDVVEQLNRITGVIVPEFDQQQAETELQIAQDQLRLAEDNYAKLIEGPDPEALSLAQTRLKSAQDQAAATRANLANLELKSPFTGTVSEVNVHSGEWVIPGQPILSLADLDHLRVETTDLSERDIPQVSVGQPVSVLIEALGQTVNGQVSEIAPLAGTLGGDVVYKTTIDLDSQPPGMRAGMSTVVQFGAGQ